MQLNRQQIRKRNSNEQRKKLLALLGIIILTLFIVLSMLNDNMFLDRLLPAAGIVSLVVLIHNLGERH